jgi:dihydrolipoamide dehydrogenase
MSDDFDVIVIGAGPGGYVAAIRCAQLGMKTACIEKRQGLGGTCLNVGCIPSKTLLHSSELYWKIKKESGKLGILGDPIQYNWAQILTRKNEVIRSLNEGIQGLFKKNKVAFYPGTASFDSTSSIVVSQGNENKKLKAKYFIIATGSEPIALPFLPFDEKRIVSSTGALSLERIPKRLAVVGAGVIGVELGSVYQRLGSEVVFIEFMDRICPGFDSAVSKALQEALVKQGMQFFLSSKVTGAEIGKEQVLLKVSLPDQTQKEFAADVVLVAVGRKAYTQDLNLEKAGIELTPKGLIPIDGNFRTRQTHILAIGDVVEGPMLAHKASEEGVAAAEILAGQTPSLSYLSIPNVVYTNPEVASVGLSEEDAKKFNLSVKVGTYSFKANSRAKCTGEEEGFIKILAESNTDRIVGVQIIGAHASELIAEAALALETGRTALEVGHLCHAHPTLSEAFKEAALSIHKKAIHR